MLRTLARLSMVDPGFDPHNVLAFGITLPPSINHATPDQIRATYRELNRQFAATPGVEAISQVWGALPLSYDDEQLFWIDGQPKPANENGMSWAVDYIVDPGYRNVTRIPLRSGRFFTPQDDEHAPLVAVVDDVFVRQYFHGQNAIGKRIVLKNTERKLEIVGVVNHVKQWGLDLDDTNSLRAQLYIPCMQMPDDFVAMSTGSQVILRYRGSMSAALGAIRGTSRNISNQQVIYNDMTMESVVADSMASRRFAMTILGAFAALALLLAGVGIYGVIAYVVGQRTHEIGIRMALGAQRRNVLGLVLWQGARLALIGVAIGIAGAAALTRLMSGLLYGVSATDPITFAAVALVLIIVALAACYFPARRATRVDPVSALRYE
jgi:predicted permease